MDKLCYKAFKYETGHFKAFMEHESPTKTQSESHSDISTLIAGQQESTMLNHPNGIASISMKTKNV